MTVMIYSDENDADLEMHGCGLNWQTEIGLDMKRFVSHYCLQPLGIYF